MEYQLEAVYRIPHSIPDPLRRFLRAKFGARPGDEFVFLPGEDRCVCLVRTLGEVAAAEVACIIPHLVCSECPDPSSGPSSSRPASHAISYLRLVE